MVDRSKKLERLVKVQRQLEKMAETELAGITRQRTEVSESLEASVSAVGSLDPVHQRFATLYANQISRLTIKDTQLQALQSVHEQKVLREKAKGDRIAENAKEARALEDRESEDNQVYDLVDLLIQLDPAQAQGKLDKG